MATTISQMGETWDMISKRVYGDEHFVDVLVSANIQHRKTAIFQHGTVLNCPDIDTTAAEYDLNIPPWKRP